MDQNTPPPPDAVTNIVFILIAIITVVLFWKIFSKAGYSGWLGLLMLVPILNFILLIYLAFAQWPILKEKEKEKISTSNPPPPDQPKF